MAARAYWQGQIRLALVSIPVEIYSASKSGAKIRFNQIHEPSGKRIKYEKTVPGLGPVDRDEIIKGYEIAKGEYVLLEDDYFEKPYYVAPKDDLAEEAFVVLREALRKAKKVALGQLSVRGSEKLVAITPCGKGLLLETLRYADEVRKGQAFFDDIDEAKPKKELLDLATTLIEEKSAPFDASEFEDRYVDALKKLIDKKAKSKSKKAIIEDVGEPVSDGGNVIDLMAALKKSVAGKSNGKASRKAAAKPKKSA